MRTPSWARLAGTGFSGATSLSIGVVRFDDETALAGGWASFNGEPAFRIRSLGDLDTSKAWILDIGYPAYMAGQLYTVAHLRRMDFLRVKPKALLAELSVSSNPDEQLRILSGIYGKTVDILAAKHGFDPSTAEITAAHALREAWPSQRPSINPSLDDELAEAMLESTQESQKASGRSPAGSVSHVGCFPRSAFAAYLLSQPLPTQGSWSQVKIHGGSKTIGVHKGQAIRGSEEWLTKTSALAETSAIYLRVSVLSMPATYARYCAFGAGANHQRRWATLPEILHLAKFCKLEIGSGFRVDAASADYEPSDIDPTISGGIAAEIEWVARSLPSTRGQGSAVGAYLRAYDRIACAKAAANVINAGYTVGSYGTGRVYVYAGKHDRTVADAMLGSGLLPSPTKKKSGVQQ